MTITHDQEILAEIINVDLQELAIELATVTFGDYEQEHLDYFKRLIKKHERF